MGDTSELQSKKPARVNGKTGANAEGRSLLSPTPGAGNFANSVKPEIYQIDSANQKKIQNDVTKIIEIVRKGSDGSFNQTLIVMLIEDWSRMDSQLGSSLGKPHLAYGFNLLANEKFTNTSLAGKVLQENNGIEQLYYFLNPSKRKTLQSSLKASVSHANYASYIKPEITSIASWELLAAQEISTNIKQKNYDAARSVFEKTRFSDDDDVALGTILFLDDMQLTQLMEDESGRHLAAQFIDALSSETYFDDERKQIEKLKHSYLKWFYARSDSDGNNVLLTSMALRTHRIQEQENLKKSSAGEIFTIPIGSAGAGMGSSGVIAKLQANGDILVKVSLRAPHIRYQKQLPYMSEITGVSLTPDAPVMLKFLDREDIKKYGKPTVVVPAAFLLEISNEDSWTVIKRIIAWGLTGFFAPFAPGSYIAAFLDAFSVVGLSIDVVRNDLINAYGEDAERFLAVWDICEAAVSILGAGMVLTNAPRLISQLPEAFAKFKNTRATMKAASLTSDELIKLEKELENLTNAGEKVIRGNGSLKNKTPLSTRTITGSGIPPGAAIAKPQSASEKLQRLMRADVESGLKPRKVEGTPQDILSGKRKPRYEAPPKDTSNNVGKPTQSLEEARNLYDDVIAETAGKHEVGIWQKEDGTYVVRIGQVDKVDAPSIWRPVQHYHTNASDISLWRMPARADIQETSLRAAGTGHSVTEIVEFPLPNNMRGRTAYTVNPDQSVRVEVFDPSGKVIPKDFKSIKEYNEYYMGHKVGADSKTAKALIEGVEAAKKQPVPSDDIVIKTNYGPPKQTGSDSTPFDTSRPMLGAPKEQLDVAPVFEGGAPVFDTSRPMLADQAQPVDVGLMPVGPRLKPSKSKKWLGAFGKPYKPKFGEPSEFSSGTNNRRGMHFNERNAAETMHGLEFDYNDTAGRPNHVKYRVDRGTGERTVQTERSFARNEATGGAQATTSDYKGTGWERGHLAQREAFKGYRDAELAADHMTNVVPMHPNLNHGPGSPWSAAERDTIKLADKYGSVMVKVTPIYDAIPPRLPNGTPIPKAINRKITAPDGKVLSDVTFLNK